MVASKRSKIASTCSRRLGGLFLGSSNEFGVDVVPPRETTAYPLGTLASGATSLPGDAACLAYAASNSASATALAAASSFALASA